jgi:hypothetical protein
MGKIILAVVTGFVTLNSVTAETRKNMQSRDGESALISQVSHSPSQARWREVNLDASRRRDPMDEAALYIANLVDDAAISPSGSGSNSDLKIRPWVGSRNSVGVKVELSW